MRGIPASFCIWTAMEFCLSSPSGLEYELALEQGFRCAAPLPVICQPFRL